MFFWAGAWLIALLGLLIHLLRQPMNRASDLYGPSMIFSLLLFSVPPALGQMRMSAEIIVGSFLLTCLGGGIPLVLAAEKLRKKLLASQPSETNNSA